MRRAGRPLVIAAALWTTTLALGARAQVPPPPPAPGQPAPPASAQPAPAPAQPAPPGPGQPTQGQPAPAQPAPLPAPAEPAPAGAAGEAPPPDAAASDLVAGEGDAIEITVIGTATDALQRVPGSGTLVSAEDMTRAQPRDVGEMLRRVPGVTVRQERDGGNRLDIGIRGFDAPRGRRVLLLEDGIPLALNPYGEPDLYYGPPVDRMRAIEVVKGSGSILFGPQTMGAVINFLTVTPPYRRSWTLAVEGGDPAYMKVLGRYGDTAEDGRTRYVIQLLHERGDGFRDQPFNGTDLLGKVTFPTSTLGEATLKVSFHDETDASTQIGLTREMFEEDPRRPTLGIHDEMAIRKYDVALIHELPFNEDTTLRTALFAYTTSRVWHNQKYSRVPEGDCCERAVGDFRIPDAAVFFQYGTTIPDRSFDVLGLEPRLEHHFKAFGMEHGLVAGARFLAESAHRQQRSGETPISSAGSVDSDETSFTYAFAAFAEDKVNVTEQLLVTPGLRFEYARSQRSIHRAFVNGEAQDLDVEGSSSVNELLPGIGMIAGSPKNHAFGGLHVGFAPPRVATAIGTDGIDQQLDAERSLNYEIGGRVTPLSWFHFEATGFLSNYVNQVIPSAGANRQGTLANAGQTRHYGVESGVNVGIGDALDLGLTLDIGARYTFSRAYFAAGQFEDNLLPYAPLHTGSATLDVEHPIGAGAQLSVGYVGDQFTDEENTVLEDAGGRVGIIDAHVIVDIAARYTHRKTGLTATLSVKNALDDPYVSSRRPDGIFPSGFRQITFGLRWDYPPEPEPEAEAEPIPEPMASPPP